MPLVRAITLFTSPNATREEVLDILNTVKTYLLKNDVRVWTFRVAYPPGHRWSSGESVCDKHMAVAYHADACSLDVDDLLTYLSTCPKGYAAIKLDDVGCVENVVRAILKVSETNPSYATRVGFSIGGFVETPYFPLATSFREGIGAAFRFTDITSGKRPREWVGEVANYVSSLGDLIERAAEEAGTTYLGLDLSLSPWMEESVVPTIEAASGVPFPLPGTVHGLRTVNDALAEAGESSGHRMIGFNEVMLAVGEDSELMRLSEAGSLRLSHLISLLPYCLVGVDMVVVDKDDDLVRGIVMDAVTAQRVKNRVVGVRLIAVEGGYADLDMFGRVPKTLP